MAQQEKGKYHASNPAVFFSAAYSAGLPSALRRPAPPVRAQGDLSRYRDKNRLLLVFAPSASDPRWRHQDALLAKSRAQFADRELLRFDIFERGAGAGLRARYHVRPGSFRVLLIGKDGYVAFGGPTPVALGELTGRIDRMPMRRDEMRRRGESR